MHPRKALIGANIHVQHSLTISSSSGKQIIPAQEPYTNCRSVIDDDTDGSKDQTTARKLTHERDKAANGHIIGVGTAETSRTSHPSYVDITQEVIGCEDTTEIEGRPSTASMGTESEVIQEAGFGLRMWRKADVNVCRKLLLAEGTMGDEIQDEEAVPKCHCEYKSELNCKEYLGGGAYLFSLGKVVLSNVDFVVVAAFKLISMNIGLMLLMSQSFIAGVCWKSVLLPKWRESLTSRLNAVTSKNYL